MKTCPFCRSLIRDEAAVCMYCGKDLLSDTLPADGSPTQPIKTARPSGQPGQEYGQPYAQSPYAGPPPDSSPSPYGQPNPPPPAPTQVQRPSSWLLIVAGLGVLLVFAFWITVFMWILNGQNGRTNIGVQVRTQISPGNGVTETESPMPTDAPTPTTPAPTASAQPTRTPQAEATLTPEPSRSPLTDKLLSAECKRALDQLSKVSGQIKNDPLKVLDDTWRKDVDQASADMKTSCGSLDSASPIPGELGQAQQSMNQASSEFDQAKLLWNQAINERDPAKAISAAQHVGEAAKYLDQAISQLQKLVP